MKKFTKLLSAMLAVMMIVSSISMIAFAENADVAITFAIASMEDASDSGGLMVTNVFNTTSGHETVEGWHLNGGKIKFNFGAEMDPDTLNPENIKIKLAGKSYIKADNAKLITVDNGDETYTYYWDYTWYEATPTSYTIDIGDMCEGSMQHTVIFTSGVKTVDQTPINEVEKNFKTGRILPRTGFVGKYIKNIAFGKPLVRYNADGTTTEIINATKYQSNYEQTYRSFISKDVWTKMDLGNYYDIQDIGIFTHWGADKTWLCDNKVEVKYSNDPNATGETATLWGNMAKGQYYYSGNTAQGSHQGRGFSRFLNPAEPVRARYLFVRASDYQYGEPIVDFKVYATVDTIYEQMTATKDGEEVTTCTGAGEYTFTVPATQCVAGTAGGYMIVAGYDINGVITAIKCEPAEYASSALTMTANMPADTVSIKASLIKDFTSPYLLTDALELPAAQ